MYLTSQILSRGCIVVPYKPAPSAMAATAGAAQEHKSDVIKLKYFDLSGFGGLSGRGGNVRFFLLANGIP
jgi:hypothetical protein